jgi:hypothetical protein
MLVFRIVMLLSEISWNEPELSRQGIRPKMLADVVPDLLSAMSPYDRNSCKGKQMVCRNWHIERYLGGQPNIIKTNDNMVAATTAV